MVHKIFTSQNNLDNGRGRHIRRLDAILDNQQKSGSDTTFQFVDTGEEQVFDSSCHSNSSFPSPINYNHPQIVKFLNKYGLDYLR